MMADETSPPLDDARLAEIQATLNDDEGMSDTVSGLTSDWASVRFSSQVKQAALDLLAEVDRLRQQQQEIWSRLRAHITTWPEFDALDRAKVHEFLKDAQQRQAASSGSVTSWRARKKR